MVEVTRIAILRVLATTGLQAFLGILSAQLSDQARSRVISCHFVTAKTKKVDSGFTEINFDLVEMMGVKITHFGCLYGCFNC